MKILEKYCTIIVKVTYKIRSTFKTRKQQCQYGDWKKKELTVEFYGTWCLPVITWNKKHSSKQVLPKTYTMDKKSFAAATFEGLWFVHIKKCKVYLGLFEFSLHFYSRYDLTNIIYEK